MARRAQTIIAWIVGIIAFVVAQQTVIALRSAGREKDPIERAMIAAINARDLMPELERRVSTLSTREQGVEFGMRLSIRGVARLPASALRARAELILKMMGNASLDVCARWSLGTPSKSEMSDLIRSLDQASLVRWAAMSAQAMEAELHNTPPRFQPSEQDIETAFVNMNDHLPPEDQDRFRQLAESADDFQAVDACWFGRSLLRGALSATQFDEGHALKVLAGLEAEPRDNM